MRELTTTRNNPMIDPSLHIWGGEIAIYLFLGGLVAGIMMISGYFLLRGRHKEVECSCLQIPALSIVLLSFGMLALFLDLEHKLFFWRMYATFKPASPMSWGSWILLLVYPALAANLLIKPPERLSARVPFLSRLSERLNAAPGAIRAIAALNLTVGAMLGIYTGILLSAFGARPLWNSAVLSILFLVSGLSTAAALVHLLARDRCERELLARADIGFLAAELMIILLFLIGLLSSTRVHIEAALLLISGPYAPVFWVFVIGLGIVIPLLIQPLAVSHRIAHTPVAPVLVIAGGLILRYVIVFAGQASHWDPLAVSR
jgi:formate-dependent nitrite reductase membrane component NrfD